MQHHAVADIPGLIAGAHENKGLGHFFLRHIERCRALLFVLDASSTEPDMTSQLRTLRHELRCHNSELSGRAGLVVANKMDAGEFGERVAVLRKCTDLPIVPISALHHSNLDSLKEAIVWLFHSHSDRTD